MTEEPRASEGMRKLVFCTSCGEQYWADERCPYCDARPKLLYDKLGITRFLQEQEYPIDW